MITPINITIHTAELPAKANGATMETLEQRDFLILLNSTKSPEEQKRALIHEVLHIWHDDFRRTDLDQIESERDRETDYLLQEMKS